MPLYAAYGSNMDAAQMKFRCPHSPAVGTGWIEGWRLTFGGEDRSAGRARSPPSSRTPPTRSSSCSTTSRPWTSGRLDEWDGADMGLYSKLQLRVQTLDGEVLAWTYVLNDYEGGLPSARYLGTMADAAEAAGAPDDYVATCAAGPARLLTRNLAGTSASPRSDAEPVPRSPRAEPCIARSRRVAATTATPRGRLLDRDVRIIRPAAVLEARADGS